MLIGHWVIILYSYTMMVDKPESNALKFRYSPRFTGPNPAGKYWQPAYNADGDIVEANNGLVRHRQRQG